MSRHFWWLLCAALFCVLSTTSRAQSRYLVIGVIAESPQGTGVALLKDTVTQKIAAFRQGHKLDSGAIIEAIYGRAIVINNGYQSLRLKVGEEIAYPVDPNELKKMVSARSLKKGITRQGNNVTIDSSLKTLLIGDNLSKVMMQAASEPLVSNGRLIGFTLWDIEPGSIFDEAGFKDGDIVTAIDDMALNDAGKAIRILNNLRSASQAEITILRDNVETKIKLHIQG